MDFITWLDTFLDEKNIELEDSFTFENEQGLNIMPYGVVMEAIKAAPKHEQKKIKDTLVMIDFKNGDVYDYLQFLGKILANH